MTHVYFVRCLLQRAVRENVCMRKAVIALALSVLAALLAGNLNDVVHAQGDLVAPGNVVAQNTGNPGEVRISWHAVPDAAYYRIGWVAYSDVEAIIASGGDWLERFAFIDIVNRSQTQHTITRLTPGAHYAFIIASNDDRYGTPQWPPSTGWRFLDLTEAPASQSSIGSASVNLTWEAAPGAAYYRIGWVVYSDVEPIIASGGDWLEHFAFVDIANRGQTEHAITRLTPGLQYAFIVAGNDGRYGRPQWPDASGWQFIAPDADQPDPQPQVGQPSCPAPGSRVSEAPDPMSTVGVHGDYDADDDLLIDVSNLQQLDAIRYDPRGRGTPTDQLRYEVAFPDAIAGMGCPLDWGCRGYELVASLNFDTNGNGLADAGDEYWNDGAGWLPIEGYRDFFYGAGHTISNLYINRDDDYVGLFGDSSVSVSHLALVSLDVSGRDFVGGLAGRAGRIIFSYATGSVSGKDTVGGLVGDGHDIEDSCADVTVSGESNIGGMVGDGGYSHITSSYAVGDVSGDDGVGGLIGRGASTIVDSYATGGVTGQGSTVGGLAGFGRVITGSYATGDVTSQGSLVGGLVGSGGGIIRDSYATGDVSGSGKRVGGLVGAVAWDIIDSYATGDVTSEDNSVGGLVGYHRVGRNISGSYATGDVSGKHYVGGLVGYHACCGRNISGSYATGDVSGHDFVGGLVGTNTSRHNRISGSYATGEVTGNRMVGGLAGVGANISGSYANGDVYGEVSVGGLIGCGGIIRASYAIGDVSGDSSVGGLIGTACQLDHARFQIVGSIDESYAVGRVVGSEDVGGLVGGAETNATATARSSYWDTNTSGQAHSVVGEGKTTAELQTPTSATGIYSSWSDHHWDFGTSAQYPVLKPESTEEMQ